MSEALPFDELLIGYIRRILSVAETGQAEWDPSSVYIYNDGPKNIRQVTLSIGFTEFGGNLKKVLAHYCELGGKHSDRVRPFLANLGSPPSRASDSGFIALLREAGKDEVMKRAQIEKFEHLYMGPAIQWATANGFTLPLSFAVIADSFLHSGSMLPFLMNSFPEKKPAAGGNEQTWIHSYLKARHRWLANHSNRLLRNTVYRANCYLEQIEKDNWQLQKAVVMNGTRVASNLEDR